MAKKKKGDNQLNEVRRSLGTKTFLITLALTMGIGAAVLIFGFLLYVGGVMHEYMVNTWNQANAEAAVISQTDYRRLSETVMSIYDSWVMTYVCVCGRENLRAKFG